MGAGCAACALPGFTKAAPFFVATLALDAAFTLCCEGTKRRVSSDAEPGFRRAVAVITTARMVTPPRSRPAACGTVLFVGRTGQSTASQLEDGGHPKP